MTKTKTRKTYLPLSGNLRVEIGAFLFYREAKCKENFDKYKNSITGPFWKTQLDDIRKTVAEWEKSKKESIYK